MQDTPTEKHNILTAEEEVKLGRIIRHCKIDSKEYTEAFQTLINQNIRLVTKQAHKFAKKTGMNVEDLIGEGRMGLITAIQKYDPDTYTDSRFATYALWWINQKIRLYLLQFQSSVHIPTYIYAVLVQYRTIINENPEVVVPDDVIMKKLNIDEKTLQTIKHANVHSISMQTPISNSNSKNKKELTIEESIRDEIKSPIELAIHNETLDNLQDAINNLSTIERDIIMEMYMNEDKVILKDLGKKHKLSSERIRQLKNQALKKLKDLLLEKAE